MTHLPLDICERLRDAGYPQLVSHFVWSKNPQRVVSRWSVGGWFIVADCPTLEEMLEWWYEHECRNIHPLLRCEVCRGDGELHTVNGESTCDRCEGLGYLRITVVAVAALVESVLREEKDGAK